MASRCDQSPGNQVTGRTDMLSTYAYTLQLRPVLCRNPAIPEKDTFYISRQGKFRK